MALNNIYDKTESDFWKRTMALVKANRPKQRPHHWTRRAPARNQRRGRGHVNNDGHSFYYHFKDHHQLNIMDYVRWRHDVYHDIDYAPSDSGSDNEFVLNPEAETGSHNMKSVTIAVVPYLKKGSYDRATRSGDLDMNAYYQGHRLSGSVFYRYSSGAGRDSYAHNGFDSLSNFMMMFHNNYHPKSIDVNFKDKQTRQWVNNKRKEFIDGYHKRYGTYQSGFSYRGLRFDNSNYQNVADLDNSTKGHGKNRVVLKVSPIMGVVGDEKFKDTRYKFRDKCINPKRLGDTWRFKHSVAYQYLCKKRGIAPALVWNWTRQGLIRSYNGSKSYQVIDCPDNKWAKNLTESLKEDKKHGFYDPKHKKMYVKGPSYDPMIEFAWKAPHYTYKKIDDVTAQALYKKLVDKYHGDPYGKGVNGRGLNNDHDKYMRGHPDLIPIMRATGQNADGSYNMAFAGMRKKTFDGMRVVGADRIYLQSDPSTAKRYVGKPRVGHMGRRVTIYTGTNRRVDKTMFSRGKQIAKNSMYGHGWMFQSGTGRDELFVAEDPTDIASLYNLNHGQYKHLNATWFSLGGVGKTYAINNVLKTLNAQPGEFKKVHLCFDNDPGGHRNVEKIMASEHNKLKYAHMGHSISVNPITHDKQSIDIVVPGIWYNKSKGIAQKQLPGDLGKFHWKDFNDVLQAVRGKNIYHDLQGSGLQKVISQAPTADLNISQYSKMIVDNTLNKSNYASISGFDNSKHMINYLALSGLLQKNVQQGAPLNLKNHYIQRMRYQYNKMDGVGKAVLDNMMDEQRGDGAQYMSPHDLSLYSSIHGDVRVNKDEARMISMPPRKFNEDVTRHVNNTMNHLRDPSGRSQQLYNLALRSTGHLMPVVQHKVHGLKAKGVLLTNSRFYNHVMSPHLKNSYNLMSENAVHYFQAKYSIKFCLVPKYAKNPDMNFNTAVKASNNYLNKHGITPINVKSVFSSEKQGRKLYSKISDIQHDYQKHVDAIHKAKVASAPKTKIKPSPTSLNSNVAKPSATSSNVISSSSNVSSKRPTSVSSLNSVQSSSFHVDKSVSVQSNSITSQKSISVPRTSNLASNQSQVTSKNSKAKSSTELSSSSVASHKSGSMSKTSSFMASSSENRSMNNKAESSSKALSSSATLKNSVVSSSSSNFSSEESSSSQSKGSDVDGQVSMSSKSTPSVDKQMDIIRKINEKNNPKLMEAREARADKPKKPSKQSVLDSLTSNLYRDGAKSDKIRQSRNSHSNRNVRRNNGIQKEAQEHQRRQNAQNKKANGQSKGHGHGDDPDWS